MADLNALAQEVAALNRMESDDFAFMDALDHIEEAGTTDADVDRLRNILNSYRLKLPNRETLDGPRVRAKDLAETLMLTTLSERIDRIRARNDVLSSLTDALETQIERANSDAGRLRQIKDAVDRATKTVNEVKALINQLTATDASVRDRLTALVDSLGSISTIFVPQN
jgi:septation ring formation regulator EzrA